MKLFRPLLLAGLALVLAGSSVHAADPNDKKPDTDGPVSFYKDVRPIFVQHCQGCHQPAKRQGGFVMTSYAELLKKGEQMQLGIVPGQVEQSFLVDQITPNKDGKTAMPKGTAPLPTTDIAKIKKWIAEGAKDDTPASVQKVVDAAHPPTYELPPVISSIAYSPDGTMLAVSGNHEILLHKADGSEITERLIGLSERIQSVAFSPDGKWLAMAGGSPGRFGEIQIWDVEKKKLKQSISVTFDTLYGLSWSHDSAKIAVGCADNTLRAFDANTGEQILFQGAHNDWVLGTTFSKDSTYLVSISRDRSVKLTEVATQRFIDNITSITPGALKGGLMAVARNPQKNDTKVKSTAAGTDMTEKWYDELVIAGADGVPRLYQMHRTKKRVIGDDFNKIREYPGMEGRIHAIAFSPDGSQFAAGSSLDGKGQLWVYETATAKVVSKLEGEPGGIFTVAFSPDGKQLASAGFDGKVRLSDPTNGKVIKDFVGVPLASNKP